MLINLGPLDLFAQCLMQAFHISLTQGSTTRLSHRSPSSFSLIHRAQTNLKEYMVGSISEEDLHCPQISFLIDLDESYLLDYLDCEPNVAESFA